MIADAQALTDNADNPEKVRQNIIEVALDYMAGDLEPDSGRVKYGVHVELMYYAQHQLDKLNTENTVYAEVEKIAPG